MSHSTRADVTAAWSFRARRRSSGAGLDAFRALAHRFGSGAAGELVPDGDDDRDRARWPLARRSAARRARFVRPTTAVRRSVVLPGPWTDG